MGFLDKSTITVDAILTKKGRERLAAGTFNITQFAVADDEIDYRLWDINHSQGSNYYGQAIENMPLTEAVPDGSKMLRYKLMTLPKNITTLPYATTAPADATITLDGPVEGSFSITVSNLSNPGRFTVVIANSDIAYFPGQQVPGLFATNTLVGDGSATITFRGRSLVSAQSTTITAVHSGTGLTIQKQITVNQDPALIL
jgi:hypothetical protein